MLVLLVATGCATRIPKAIVLDVDRSGQVSLRQRAISEAALAETLKQRFESHGASPVLIRGESEASHKSVRNVMDLCLFFGHGELVLSLLAATPENLQPWLSEDLANRRHQFQLREPPEVRSGEQSPLPPGFHILITQQGFVVESQKIEKEDLLAQLARLSQSEDTKKKDVLITCLSDSSHGNTVWLLEACGRLGLERVWLTSM